MKKIKIIGSPDDFHCAAVNWALKKSGIDSQILDSFRGIHNFTSIDQEKIHEIDGKKNIYWFRRLYKPAYDEVSEKLDTHIFSQREKMTYQSNFITNLEYIDKCEWVNKPSATQLAEKKVYQLYAAKKFQLSVPNTYFGSNLDEILEKFHELEEIVVKPFDAYQWIYSHDNIAFSLAKKILITELREIGKEIISHTPAIYQEPISKICDIRVFVVGNSLTAVKITSCDAESYGIDVREFSSIPKAASFEEVLLPPNIQKNILAMLKFLDIDMASIDFVQDENENYVFLDLNPGGAWMFLELNLKETRVLQKTALYFATRSGKKHFKICDFPDVFDFINSEDFIPDQKSFLFNGKRVPNSWSENNKLFLNR